MPRAYYNEIDPNAAEWLRELIKADLIAPGEVDERSIVDVKSEDLTGYTQCHFFAGIGIWSAALRLAGVPDSRPVWSGSCPCQGYSVAGKGKGAGEDRDLWPVFASLISECQPTAVYGEQVAAAIRFGWLDRLRTDLEKEVYAVGSIIAGAHSAGADHIRQRLWWVGFAKDERHTGRATSENERTRNDGTLQQIETGRGSISSESSRSGAHSGLGNTIERGERGGDQPGLGASEEQVAQQENGASAANQSGDGCDEPAFNLWTDSRWHQCRDGKARRVPAVRAIETESGIQLVADDGAIPCGKMDGGWNGSLFPLAKKTEGRVMILRGAGNAINLGTAAAFIQASEEAIA